MIRNFLLLFIFISLAGASSIYSQEDSTWTDEDEWDEYEYEFKMWDLDFKGRPTISVTYGFTNINHDEFLGTFADVNSVELKLGYTSQEASWYNENIVDYRYRYFYLSNYSNELGNKEAGRFDIKSELWSLGFGRAKGYGYRLGQSAVVPYYSYSFGWSRFKNKDNSVPLFQSDAKILNSFNESFRFGTTFESGIRIQLIPALGLEASYNRSIIFPRHLFWKWCGSVAIEAAGQWMVDEFVDEVLESSPYAGPIVNFLLKSALSFGVYELRQEKMNWPFSSAAPLSYDSFRAGLTFVL